MESLGLRNKFISRNDAQNVDHVIVRRPLTRVLEFTRRTIDDVINDPIARNEVRGYFKLYKWIGRQGEISELERQWNAR